MNEPLATPQAAVTLQGIGKVYRLYQKPGYRVLDLLGLCPPGPSYYTEHTALKNINIVFGRGEKIAIIGRNGAGKSTLLKIITGVVKPTAGAAGVVGRVSALLQIGTGFHPDFTGRQNVYSGLAYMGITGAEADCKFSEIVDFAELEEYIEQPMKTYSTGMCARLMFSASTVIEPEILVIDELLGVGDAYFAHKSYERIRRMCEKDGTTLLMVTHDIYTALNLCERFIWIDRGEVKFDGDGKSAINAYENSIKVQEEERLLHRNLNALAGKGKDVKRLRIVFRSRTGFALPSPLALARLEVRYEDGTALALPVAEGAPGWTLLPEGNLGPPQTVAGRACRCLGTQGSIYHKAEWCLDVPKIDGLKSLHVNWNYDGQDAVDVLVLDGDSSAFARAAISGASGWQESVFQLAEGKAQENVIFAEGHGQYGSGLVRITAVEFQNARGQKVARIQHGERLTVRVRCAVKGQLPRRAATFVLGFHRGDVSVGAYAYTHELNLGEGDDFAVDVVLDPVLLGSGKWLVTVGVAEADMYKQGFNPYFTINPRWYHNIARGFELEVERTGAVEAVSFFVHPSKFILNPASDAYSDEQRGQTGADDIRMKRNADG